MYDMTTNLVAWLQRLHKGILSSPQLEILDGRLHGKLLLRFQESITPTIGIIPMADSDRAKAARRSKTQCNPRTNGVHDRIRAPSISDNVGRRNVELDIVHRDCRHVGDDPIHTESRSRLASIWRWMEVREGRHQT